MNRKHLHQTNIVSSQDSHTKISVRFTILYSLFLCIILFLVIYLHLSASKSSQAEFWYQNHASFNNAVTLLDNDFMAIETYCRQLTQESTFLTLARAEDTNQNEFFLNGFRLKNEMPTSLVSYPGIPVTSYFIYLRNTQYVASINSFKSDALFYERNYPSGIPDYETWKDYIYADNGTGTMHFITGKSADGVTDSYLYLVNLNTLSYKNIPVTAGFQISSQKLRNIFFGISLEDGGCLLALDENNTPVFYFTENDSDRTAFSDSAYASLTGKLPELVFHNETASLSLDGKSMHITRSMSAANGYHYYLIQPASLYVSAYESLFIVIFAAAVILGLFVVVLLVKNSMRPYVALNSELQETITDRNQLQEVVNATKPIIYDTYLRQLMYESVSTQDELDYIRSFLRLENPELSYYVLYGIIYESDFVTDGATENTMSTSDLNSLVHNALAEYFSYHNMLYLFSPKERTYALLFPFEGGSDEMLISLQEKVLKVHTRLLEEYSIWFFTGIGLPCAFSNIWESYQQAKDASGYTSKNYIFLPYEMLKKDSHAYYYPAEFSSRMIQAITTGSTTSVIELFGLIHQENIEQRSLPLQLLRFLLSDIRNTLLKARFSITSPTAEQEGALHEIDELLADENLSFRSCYDTALKLCTLFHPKQEKNTLIEDIVAYIRTNYKDPSLCLNKLSDEFGISESYFSHMFKENMNINFSVYLEDLRLNEAARLIKEGNSNLTEVSFEVGYNNPTSFRRAFKKKFGVTPSAMAAQ